MSRDGLLRRFRELCYSYYSRHAFIARLRAYASFCHDIRSLLSFCLTFAPLTLYIDYFAAGLHDLHFPHLHAGATI